MSRLRKLPAFLERCQSVVAWYDSLLAGMEGAEPLGLRPDVLHTSHLYVLRLAEGLGRAKVLGRMRGANFGVNVHYVPMQQYPYYRKRFGRSPGLCPTADAAYGRIISQPMYAGLSDADVKRVVASLGEALR